MDDEDDLAGTIGSIFGRKDRVAAMRQLAKETNGDKSAMDNLRHGVVDHMINNVITNKEAGDSSMKPDQFHSFLRGNRATLRQVLTGKELVAMEQVAMHLRRAAKK